MGKTKKIFITGVFYNAVAKYSGVLIGLAVTAVLSRLLPPEQFGIIAIAMVFISFFSILSDIGIGTAIIQKKELTPADLSHIFSLTIYVALLAAILFFFVSGAIAGYYQKAVLSGICQILSVQLFFSVTNIVPNGLLLKNKEFRFIAIRTFAVQSTGGLLAIIAALHGLGIYSLLIAPVFSSTVIFCINYLKYRIPFVWRINIEAIRKIASYSVYQFLFNVINFFSRNLDNLLIGKCLGFTPLGYYEKSYRLMLLPMSNISYVITSVIHPVFSDHQHDTRQITEMYLKVVRWLAYIGFPLSVLLFFSAKELIWLLFGDQWGASVPVFRLLSISVGFQMVVSSAGAIFQASNSTKWLFIDGLLSSIFTILCLFIGIFGFRNLNETALLISVSFILNFFKSFFILFRFVLKQKQSLFYRQLVLPCIISGNLFLWLNIVSHIVPDNLLIALTVKTSLTLFTLLVFAHLFGLYNLSNLVKQCRKKILKSQ